jgi:UDP-2,3-diacylglucosamine pyrophosphatase LpxH
MAPNLLIVSDVHLCRLRLGMMSGGQRELGPWLDHHAEHPEGGRPWRLLVNGDLFDFDHQAMSLSERGAEEASLRLFQEIAGEFPDVLAALARFLDAGHEVVILPGNHDCDLAWPSVREALRARVAASLADPASLSRLTFREWFYYEPGRIWVEHGHQYDADNAIVGQLDPFDPGPRLRPSLGTHWIAGFCPVIPEIAYHVDHTRNPLYYIPIAAKKYGLKAPWMWLRYAAFALRTLASAGRSHGRPGAGHGARRAALASECGLPEKTLLEIEAAAAPPRLASRAATAARLHVLPVLLLPVVVTLGILAAAFGSAPLAITAAALFAVVAAGDLLVGRRFHGHAEASVATGARRVQGILGVPHVSFGHIHIAGDEAVGEGRYLNSGTWVSPHLPLTYLRLVGEEARLCTWEPGRARARREAVEGLPTSRPPGRKPLGEPLGGGRPHPVP